MEWLIWQNMIAWAVTAIIRPIFREVILQGRWAAVVHTQGALCCSCPRAPRIWSSTQGNKESLRSKWTKHKTPTIWYEPRFPTLYTLGEFTSPGLHSSQSNNLLLNCVQSKILSQIWRRIKSSRESPVMDFKGRARILLCLCTKVIKHANFMWNQTLKKVRSTHEGLLVMVLQQKANSAKTERNIFQLHSKHSLVGSTAAG